MELIPAIDILEGRCVRLKQGDYRHKVVYASEPLEVAQEFERHGARSLHLVDLEGARLGKVTHLKVLSAIVRCTSLKIDFSGGIKSVEDVQAVLDAGATWVTLGSVAAYDIPLTKQIIQKFGAEKIMLGADVRKEILYIHGWRQATPMYIERFIHLYCEEGFAGFSVRISRAMGCFRAPP